MEIEGAGGTGGLDLQAEFVVQSGTKIVFGYMFFGVSSQTIARNPKVMKIDV